MVTAMDYPSWRSGMSSRSEAISRPGYFYCNGFVTTNKAMIYVVILPMFPGDLIM